MAQVTRSATLDATPAQVWAVIGGFQALPDWHPAVADSDKEIIDGVEHRRLSLEGGGEILERNLGADAMSYGYTIIESPLPVADYTSIISVADAGGKALVVWSSTFKGTTDGASDVVGDIMYVHTPFPNLVYALDLDNDGVILWKYEPKQDPDVIPVICCDTVNRRLAYANGVVFLHQADTTIVAFDALSGQVKWTAVNGDPSKGATNTATVLPVKDMIIVGISGGEFGVQPHVTAYDINTGERR